MINYLLITLLTIPGVLVATTMHEFTRAAFSTYFGDTLPKNKKKLTLNPIRHFEPIGFILILVTGGFGWGQPVETSALYYKNRKMNTLVTAIAPNVVNLILAFVFLLLSKLNLNLYLVLMFSTAAQINIALAVYNCVPVTPMDCVKVLSVVMPANKYFQYMQYEKVIQMGFLLLLFVGGFGGFFNFIIQFIMRIFNMLLFFV